MPTPFRSPRTLRIGTPASARPPLAATPGCSSYSGPDAISLLPDEVLVLILGWLDPASLSLLPVLSHRFFALLSTPDAFTSALLRRFTRLPYIRTQARWPAEYAARVSLENSWSAAPRATTISIDAPFLFLDSESDRAVAYSKERSVTFDTTTGRISRDGVKTELPVSVSKCDTNRSAFGLSTGSLLISQNNGGLLSLWIPVTLSESNGAAVNAWRDPHEGKVTALAWDRGLNNLLASGSDEILLWDLSGFPSKDEKNRVVGRLVFPDVATEDATPKPVPTVVKLIVSQRGHIFALLSNGLLASWTLELLQLLQKPNADPVLPNYTTQLDPTAAILGFENDAASGRLLACSESECTVFSNSLSEHARLFVPIGEKLSVATWDRIYAPLEPTLIQPNPKPLSAIALGTESGSILLYDLPGHAVNEPIAPRLSLPYPSRSDGSGRVTHLLVGAVVVVSGHRDGSLLIRSVLSGALLRRLELNLPRVQRTIESDGDGVMSLAISEARGKIVAGIGGGGIRIWSFGGVHEGPWKQQARTVVRKRKPRNRGGPFSSSPRQQAHADLRSDLFEMRDQEAEEQRAERAMGRLQRGFSSEAGWTEEELIEYTLMLSRNTNGNGHGNRNEEWEPDPEPDWPSSVESGAGSFGGRSWNGNAGRHRTSIGSGHSPSLRPGNSPRVSARTREEVEDEELQFVLQLSLVDK